MRSWSIGWRIDIVFECRKTNWMFVKLEMGRCAGQSSMIIAIFLSSTRNFRSSLRTQCSKISLLTQVFFFATYCQGKCLTFLKQHRFSDMLIINTGNSSPVAFATAILVALTLLFFPLEHFSLLGNRFYREGIGRRGQIDQDCLDLPIYNLIEWLARLFYSKNWSSYL